MPSIKAVDFAGIYHEHRDLVRRQLEKVAPLSEVDDLEQVVFAKVSKNLSSFKGQSSLRTWIARIAMHTAHDHVRSRAAKAGKRTLSLETLVEEKPACACHQEKAPSAPGKLVKKEMCECVREHLGLLSRDYQQILLLREEAGLSNQEVAKRLGITLATVKIRLHRAREVLRGVLNEACDFYITEENTIACDRKPKVRAGVR